MKRIIPVLTILILLVLTSWTCTRQRQLNVMCSGGFTAAYQQLSPLFEAENNTSIHVSYGASMGVHPNSIPERLKRGEMADLVIMANEGLESLIDLGIVIPGSRTDLASSRIGMAVRSGTPIPDIRTEADFIRVLEQAKSIAHSVSASGVYLTTELFPELENGRELLSKCIAVSGEMVGSVVARGEAEIGFQQVSELLPVEGIIYLGTIPESMQKITVFSAGILKSSKNKDLARKLIQSLSSLEAAPLIKATGMEPLH